MFIQDQEEKVIFNMKFYSLKRVGKKIKIFDNKDNYLGILAEYNSEEITKIIIEEIVELLKFCFENKMPCIYKFPAASEIEKVMENEKLEDYNDRN